MYIYGPEAEAWLAKQEAEHQQTITKAISAAQIVLVALEDGDLPIQPRERTREVYDLLRAAVELAELWQADPSSKPQIERTAVYA